MSHREYISIAIRESGSFQPWLDSAGSFRSGSFRPNFGVGRFGLIRWVVLARSRSGTISIRLGRVGVWYKNGEWYIG